MDPNAQNAQRLAAEAQHRSQEAQRQMRETLERTARMQESMKRMREQAENSRKGFERALHAREIAKAAPSSTDGDMENLYSEGRSLYEHRRFSESSAAFVKLANDAKYAAAGNYGLGVLSYARGDLSGASAYFKKCRDDAPDYADAIYYQAKIAQRRGSPYDGAALYRQALEKAPDHAGAKAQLQMIDRYTLENAKALYRARRFSDSVRAFESLTHSDLYRPAGYYGLGVIEFRRGNYGQASRQLNHCLDLHPNHANARYYLGRIAEQLKQPEDARKMYRSALEINPSHAGALLQLKRLQQAPREEKPGRKSTEKREGRASQSPAESPELETLRKLVSNPEVRAALERLSQAEAKPKPGVKKP